MNSTRGTFWVSHPGSEAMMIRSKEPLTEIRKFSPNNPYDGRTSEIHPGRGENWLIRGGEECRVGVVQLQRPSSKSFTRWVRHCTARADPPANFWQIWSSIPSPNSTSSACLQPDHIPHGGPEPTDTWVPVHSGD